MQKKMSDEPVNPDYPASIEAAVRLLQSMVPPEELVKITQMEEDELIRLHRGLGMSIRNNFGLWKGNKALLLETGKRHPDDASGVIITALWRTLRDSLPKVH